MFRKYVAAVALAFSMGSSALAAPYEYVGRTEKVAVFLDRGSVKTVGANKRAWSTNVLRKDRETAAYYRNLYEYDCVNERSRVLHFADYTAKGQVVDFVSDPQAWAFVVPESVGANLLRLVCGASSDPSNFWDGDPASNVELVRKVVDYMETKGKP